jgi:hypothetical protein
LITHEQLVETFGEDEVLLASAELLEGRMTDPEALRVLTEVGLPDSLFETLSFEDFTDGPPRTLAETFLSTADGMPERVRDYLIVANGPGGGVACLDGLGRAVSGDHPALALQLGAVHSVPGVPTRDPQDHLHHQRHRVVERPVPPGHQTARALPDRPGRIEGALPGHSQSPPEQG